MVEIEIPSDRTAIRPFSASDAEDVFACISPAITQFMSWSPPSSLASFEEVWREWLPAIHDGSDLHLVIRMRESGLCIGIAGLHALLTRRPELGIWLREDMHGLGIGSEVIGAVVGWASMNFDVESFEYPVAEENTASRRIAERYGGKVMERRTNPKYRAVVYHIPARRCI